VTLQRLELDSEQEPTEIGPVAEANPWLLSGGEALWIVGSESMGFYKDGNISMLPAKERLGDISRPFLYEGYPAVLERRPEGFIFRIFMDDGWRKKDSWQLGRKVVTSEMENLGVVKIEETIHFFLEVGNTLYYSRDIHQRRDDQDSWKPVVKVDSYWTVFSLGGEPVIFHLDIGKQANTIFTGEKIVGLKQKGAEWRSFFSVSVPMVIEMGVYPISYTGEFAVAFQPPFGKVQVLEVKGNKVEQGRIPWISKIFPFPTGLLTPMFISYSVTFIMPLILAFILSVQMRKYRVCEHVAGTATVHFAPLWRRAIAQIIDLLFLGGPMIAMFILFISKLGDASMFRQILAFILGGFLWMLIGLSLFAFLEGRWGRTPGKWIMKIQVLGTDLKPCGFGRAIVRNLLKFVDGFLNYMIGILLVALSENWQRLGDMAARTVVISVAR